MSHQIAGRVELAEPLYREIADLCTSTDRRRVRSVAERIAHDYKACLRRPAANNTVRNRLSLAATFLRWCVREGHVGPGVLEALTDRVGPSVTIDPTLDSFSSSVDLDSIQARLEASSGGSR